MARPAMRNSTPIIVAEENTTKEQAEALVKHTNDMYEHVKNGRVLAELASPSMIPGLRTIHVVMCNALPTAGIDKYWRTYWNPDFIQFLVDCAAAVSPVHKCPTCNADSHHPLAYLGGLWLHEAGHMVFDHPIRYKEFVVFESKEFLHRWNLCADAEMNDDIPQIGQAATASKRAKGDNLPQICLPSKVLVDKQARYTAKTSQAYWAAYKPPTQPTAGFVLDDFGIFPKTIKQEDGNVAEHYFENYEEPEKEEENYEGEKGDPFPMQGEPDPNDHGSGASGADRPWEAGDPEGEGKGVPGTSSAEGKAVRRNVAQEIKKQKANGYGHVPGGWDVFADTLLTPPKVRWQDRLHAMARQAITRCRGERMNTYRKLSRASITHRVAVKGTNQKKVRVVKPSTYDITPVVIVVVDTSGSMGSGRKSRLEQAMCEAEGILKHNGVKGYFLDCDANVYGNAQDVTSVRKARVSGGGGTDMRVGVLAAKAQKIKPDIVVLITDGDTMWSSPQDVVGLNIITAIIHETGINGCPLHMNPIWVPVNDD